ncbi:alcohol dehydrogenase catalytic domain-containing protein, partial [uncultured Sphingomonas sp.]|uniref:alcohol dehydrogenase catalytic domain-containing protein n=1 Tax=uncultured Sphingomonas sp. TaxID=158754 RepID=UPI002630E56F
MSETMQAAILAAPERFEMVEIPRPEPGPGEVRIRLEGCGVCASNVEPWQGQPWSSFPGEAGGMGHEGWGIVDALGSGVSGVAIGTRVAALSYRSFAAYD